MSSVTDFTSQGTIGASLLPQRYDIKIYQGDTFTFDLILENNGTPLDVTSWTGNAEINKDVLGTPGETPNLGLTIGTTDGKITVDLTATESAALIGDTQYYYDIELTDTGGNVRTFIGGFITVTKDITDAAE